MKPKTQRTPAMPDAPEGATLQEMSKKYGMSVRTLLRDIEAGKLRAFKIGRSYRCTFDQISDWLKGRYTT